MKPRITNLILLFTFVFLPCTVLPCTARVLGQETASANAQNSLRSYVELRLQWADWKEYSRFIAWPDEPAWDCWWVAKTYRMGNATTKATRVLIPVTYVRIGLFCADFQFEGKPDTETINYELVRKSGAWKVDGPIPDYPYISEQALYKSLTNTIADEKESTERKVKARKVLKAITSGSDN